MGMPSQEPQSRPSPTISVVMPVLNEARDLNTLLDQVLNQKPPAGGFEVLVVDGGSTDDTRSIVTARGEDCPNLLLLDNPRRLSGAGRNVGARAARGKYVLFLDGHCALPRDDYLIRTVELFESTGASCLCRPQPLNRMAANEWSRAISAARHSWLGHYPASDIYGGPSGFTDPSSAGAAYARSLIEDLGGYDERFDACEDVEFNHRVALGGFPSYFHPDLTVEYRPRASLGAFFRQMFRYGRGRARLMARHPTMIPWPLVLTTAYVALAVVTCIAYGLREVGPMAGIPIAAWLLATGIESLRLARSLPGFLKTWLAFAVIHGGLLLGFWRALPELHRFRAGDE